MEVKDSAVLAGTLHRELGLRDDFIASNTTFAFAGTARDPLQTVARQNTALESTSNEKAQRLCVRHGPVLGPRVMSRHTETECPMQIRQSDQK